jgi:hypothetical protein
MNIAFACNEVFRTKKFHRLAEKEGRDVARGRGEEGKENMILR